MLRRYVLALFTVVGLLAGATAAVATYRALFPSVQVPSVLDQHLEALRIRLAEAKPGYLAIIGDSLTADAPEQEVCGTKLVPVAFGGAQIEHAQQHLLPLLVAKRPSALIVAMGVNDAQRRIAKSREQLLSGAATTYRQLLHQATKLTPHVAVVLNPPVGQGQPMGDVFFDPGMITAINDIIRTAAGELDLPVFSLAELAGPDGFARAGVTLDGVHPSPSGYAIWAATIAEAARHLQPCPRR
jgi:lysophospholipase L1-like esterase